MGCAPARWVAVMLCLVLLVSGLLPVAGAHAFERGRAGDILVDQIDSATTDCQEGADHGLVDTCMDGVGHDFYVPQAFAFGPPIEAAPVFATADRSGGIGTSPQLRPPRLSVPV